MDRNQFEQIIKHITALGVKAIKDNTEETDYQVDYVAIFANNDTEFGLLFEIAHSLGQEKVMGLASTGSTFLLRTPIETEAGLVSYIKIRKPDPTKPQRGGPDFRIKNYEQFKQKYLQKSDKFRLIVRKNYEMIELKAVDVLVYFPSNFAETRSKDG